MNHVLGCSFCGKSHKAVKKLIAGPSVYICDECVRLCHDIVVDEWVPSSGRRGEAAGRLLARLYEDVVKGAVVAKPETARRLNFGKWCGFHEVTLCRHDDISLYVTFWLDGSEDVTVDTTASPGWLADRIRMIWMECNAHETNRAEAAVARLAEFDAVASSEPEKTP